MTSPDQDAPPGQSTFADLQIHPAVLQAVSDVGYETPSAIQAATIPIQAEYEALGMDTVKLQTQYILTTGAGMLSARALAVRQAEAPASRVVAGDIGNGVRQRFERMQVGLQRIEVERGVDRLRIADHMQVAVAEIDDRLPVRPRSLQTFKR